MSGWVSERRRDGWDVGDEEGALSLLSLIDMGRRYGQEIWAWKPKGCFWLEQGFLDGHRDSTWHS